MAISRITTPRDRTASRQTRWSESSTGCLWKLRGDWLWSAPWMAGSGIDRHCRPTGQLGPRLSAIAATGRHFASQLLKSVGWRS